MDFKSIIGAVAPWIATAMGTPLAGMAVEAAAGALGLSEKTVDAVKTAISGATPEQMLALKNADAEFALKMQALGFEHVEALEKLAIEDRASARQREMTVKDLTPSVLGYIVTIGFFGLLGYLATHDVPNTSERILDVMIGSLGTAWIGIINYYYGSSSGSSRKTELLAQAPAVK